MLRNAGPLLAALIFLVPLVGASGAPYPRGAHEFEIEGRTAAWWIGEPATAGPQANSVNSSVPTSGNDTLWFAVLVDRLDPNATSLEAYVNVSSDQLKFAVGSGNITKDYSAPNVTSEAFHFVGFPFAAPPTAGTARFSFTIDAVSYNGTNVSSSAHGTGSGEVVIAGSVVAPAPGIPRSFLIGAGVILLAAIVAGAYGVRQRNVRRRMRGRTRSTTLKELEQEEKARKPEHLVQVQQEIRQQEQVRAQRRELQILIAKRADAQKGIELLRKRHELGALSKLQYDNMVAKRQGELAKIEAEIAQMEAGE